MKEMKAKTFFLFITVTLILFMPPLLATQELGLEVISRPTDIEYKAQDLRDPFESYLTEEGEVVEVTTKEVPISPPHLEIQGIIWGGILNQAIINNKVVGVGDEIEEAKIIKIDKEGIIVLYKGKRFNLSSPAKANLEDIKKEE